MTNVSAELNLLLADYQVLYQKLRTFHWNVKGPLFFGLHEKFEELYLQTAETVDELAERVLALGDKPLGTLKDQLDSARLSEASGDESAEQMVAAIRDDLATLDAPQRALVEKAAAANDQSTANLVDGLCDAQEKTRWMLGAFLGG